MFSGICAQTVIDNVGLNGYEHVKANTLSAGLARILTIAVVLSTRPQLLILDEVTVGLDYIMKQQVWRAILK